MADWLITWSVWHWLVLGFVLLIAETLVPGVFFIVVGFGCDCGCRRNGVGAEFILNCVSHFLCDFSDYSLVALVEIST